MFALCVCEMMFGRAGEQFGVCICAVSSFLCAMIKFLCDKNIMNQKIAISFIVKTKTKNWIMTWIPFSTFYCAVRLKKFFGELEFNCSTDILYVMIQNDIYQRKFLREFHYFLGKKFKACLITFFVDVISWSH